MAMFVWNKPKSQRRRKSLDSKLKVSQVWPRVVEFSAISHGFSMFFVLQTSDTMCSFGFEFGSRHGICVFFFLWLSFSRSQVIIKWLFLFQMIKFLLKRHHFILNPHFEWKRLVISLFFDDDFRARQREPEKKRNRKFCALGLFIMFWVYRLK